MRNTAMRISLVLTVALATGGAQGQPPPGKTGLIYPLVPGHGGVVPLPRAAEQPRKGAKAVFDVTADVKPGAVNKGLEQVARLLNLYGAAGLKAGDVQIAAVCHGAADQAVLSDAAYLARFKVAANPNLPLIRALKRPGSKCSCAGSPCTTWGSRRRRWRTRSRSPTPRCSCSSTSRRTGAPTSRLGRAKSLRTGDSAGYPLLI